MELHAGHHQVVQWLGLSFNIDTLINTWVVMAIVLVITLLAARKRNLIPSGVQNMMEMVLEALRDQLRPGIEKQWSKVSALLFTLFLFIFVANQLGLMPTNHLLSSPTADVNTPLALAIISTVVIWGIGFQVKGIGYLKHLFQPFKVLVILNVFEEVAKPITLTVRLFGNIIAGEILLELLYTMVPAWIPVAWVWLAFSLFVGTIQAFVFAVLTSAYLNQGLGEEH
ncbi:MAG: F0F1 ATP synthase subunit A [Veillonella sp.]|nr:F0F1 ATP synthase subunit A [Veillonella sp.]MCF0155749.1 F0F1 ATP synthase subunit A [Veillonella sp.]